MNINNFHTICVVGFGRTGVYLVDLLVKLGKRVKVTDKKDKENFSPFLIKRFSQAKVNFEFSQHTKSFIEGSDLVVVSPGVDIQNTPIIEIADKEGIPVVGEIELVSWLTSAKIVAITGTNGKTTTSFLTYRILKRKGKNVYLAGNIGIPFSCYALVLKPSDIVILEVSSFQLESIIEFKPFIACLLNLKPDHLDRYQDFDSYIRAKLNIFRNHTGNEWAVLNKEIFNLKTITKNINSRIVYFSSELSNPNFSAVYRVLSILGIDKTDCIKFFADFKGLPHRFQIVRKVRGITFINDSKATNPTSTIWALKNINSDIILIAGGKDKGLDYTVVKPYLRRVKKINLIGESADKIRESLSYDRRVYLFNSLREAVRDAYASAGSKDTVLFSPMCSSFDMFSNYIERGRRFIEIVNAL